MECIVITGTSASDLQTNVNTWLHNPDDTKTVRFVAMCEGTVGAAVLKAIIFYEIGIFSART